jgi:hypothetical protein
LVNNENINIYIKRPIKMDNKRVIPITRINKFFSAEDFDLEISMGREAIEGDGNFTLILYKVNRQLTESDNLYGEASKDGIRFYPPIELKVMPSMAEPENKAYDKNGTNRYLQDGRLTFSIYSNQLHELKTSIDYGDYIGYPVTETEIRYFSVVNDGVKNYDNKHTIMGYKGAFHTVVCAPVDGSEFRGV